MATETTNYHFIKPDDDDPVDNTPLNHNFDRIDEIIAGHVADTNNPHQVTKEQVGLGNVDNTSDADKPISTAVRAPLARLIDAGAKNLLRIASTSQTIDGVTFTVNDDRTITVDGTNTGTGTVVFTICEIKLPANITYSLSGCPNGGSFDTYYIGSLDTTSWQAFLTDIGAGSFGSLTTSMTIRFRIGVRPGETVPNQIFKPMLCTAEDYTVSTEFVPYRPSYDELVARIEALEQAAGINSVRSMANLTTETAADATETEGGEVR